MLKFARAAALSSIAASLLLVPAAEAIPPGGPKNSNKSAKATLHASAVTAGRTIRVSGTGFPKRRTVTVKLDDQTILATFRISSTGRFSGRVPIPSRTRKGAHWLRFLAPSPATSVKRSFRVR